MTGKDFSGPTPVIRAPIPVRMVDSEQNSDPQNPEKVVRKKSRTPAISQDDKGEEVLGDVEEFEDKSENEVAV
jgi:transcription factor TFIIIB component B''